MRKGWSPSALSPAPMDDRNLILGVLAAQAGFVTPAQVMTAASMRMLARDGRSLLDHLVDSGALTPERRDLVMALANEALAANGGSPERVLESVDGARALSFTLGALPGDSEARAPAFEGAEVIPVEPEGKYSRLDELGRGGQSIVWRALDRFVGREVALKELTPPGTGDSRGSTRAARARFLREARLTAQLDHPGIVAVHELAKRPDGTLYSAQKLIRGRTLKAALAQSRTLSQRLELLPHLLDAAQAVAYAHARSVVHRDLKPSNVMVGPYGETVVVDWGLAKRRGETEPAVATSTSTPESSPELTQAGVALGTPSYMSPEQAQGRPRGHRRAKRRVQPRGDALRATDRQTALRGGRQRPGHRGGAFRTTGTGPGAVSGGATGAGRDRRARAPERPGRALSGRRRLRQRALGLSGGCASRGLCLRNPRADAEDS